MNMVIIIVGAAGVFLVLWAISCRRRLTDMDEDINNAMVRIGVQISARFDALTALLDLTGGYAAHEAQMLIETVKSHRSDITVASTPDDILRQEGVITKTLDHISMVAERYPDLKADENYTKCMNALNIYEKMVCTSCLIYNDSVTRLNRELRRFPVSLIARASGFRQRDYLVVVEDKADQYEI